MTLSLPFNRILWQVYKYVSYHSVKKRIGLESILLFSSYRNAHKHRIELIKHLCLAYRSIEEEDKLQTYNERVLSYPLLYIATSVDSEIQKSSCLSSRKERMRHQARPMTNPLPDQYQIGHLPCSGKQPGY